MTTLADLRRSAECLPVGTSISIPREALIAALDAPASEWREKIWICPPETRLGVAEVAGALGRPKSFVYRATGPAAGDSRIPHRKLAGELVFLASEIRAWIRDNEEVVEPAHASSVLAIATGRAS